MSDNTTNTQNWKAGEVVNLPKERRTLKSGNSVAYEQIVESRYMCVREAGNGRRGILVKVLGKAYGGEGRIIKGQPYWDDDVEILFYGARYSSYPLPSAEELKEVLGIVRGNESLVQQFEQAGMRMNVNSTFWVKDIKRQMGILKKLQYLDGRDGQLYPAKGDDFHYRISIVYFQNGELSW